MIQSVYHYLLYDYQRFAIERAITKERKKQEKEVTDARRSGKTEAEIRDIQQDWRFHLEQFFDQRELIVTRHWLKRARKYDLKTPRYDESDMWEESKWFHDRLLTAEGIDVIRKAWREEISWRVTTFSGVGGLIVAAGGLAVAFLSLVK